MQCRTCGAPLPSGAANCPNCGAATPYNASVGSYDPTQRAGQAPPTSYGSPPPPPSMPGVDPSYPYGNSSPYNSTPYGGSGAAYPTPQTPAPQQQGYPQQYNNVPPMPGGYPQGPQGPRKSNTTTIVAIVSVVVVLLVVIGAVLVANANKGSGTGGNTSTPTAVVNGTTPTQVATQAPTAAPTTTNDQVDPTAAAIVVKAQTASAIDKNYEPTTVTSTFQSGDTVYVTFQMNLANIPPKNGVYGNVQVKFINNGSLFKTGTLDNVDTKSITSVTDGNITAYFSYTNYPATTNGMAKLYWCDTNDCTNPKLAQTATFTVS